MVDGIKDGAAPKAVTTYMEEPAAPRLRGRQRDVRCATGPTPTRSATEGAEGQGQVRGRAVPGVRGRRQGRHPRRPQHGHLGLLEEPGRRAEAHRLPDRPRADRRKQRRRSTPRRRCSTRPTTTPAVKKALPFAAELKQAVEQAKSAPGLAGLHRRSRRRSTRTSTRRCRAQTVPEAALKKAQTRHQQGAGHLLGETETMEAATDQGRPTAEAALPRASRSAASRR